MLWSSSITAIVGIDCTVLPRRCFSAKCVARMRWRGKRRYVFDNNFEMWRVCNRIGCQAVRGEARRPKWRRPEQPHGCRRDRARSIVISKIHQSLLRGCRSKTSKSLRFAPPISPSGSDSSSKNLFSIISSPEEKAQTRVQISDDIYSDVVSRRSFEVGEDAMEARLSREFYP